MKIDDNAWYFSLHTFHFCRVAKDFCANIKSFRNLLTAHFGFPYIGPSSTNSHITTRQFLTENLFVKCIREGFRNPSHGICPLRGSPCPSPWVDGRFHKQKYPNKCVNSKQNRPIRSNVSYVCVCKAIGPQTYCVGWFMLKAHKGRFYSWPISSCQIIFIFNMREVKWMQVVFIATKFDFLHTIVYGYLFVCLYNKFLYAFSIHCKKVTCDIQINCAT